MKSWASVTEDSRYDKLDKQKQRIVFQRWVQDTMPEAESNLESTDLNKWDKLVQNKYQEFDDTSISFGGVARSVAQSVGGIAVASAQGMADFSTAVYDQKLSDQAKARGVQLKKFGNQISRFTRTSEKSLVNDQFDQMIGIFNSDDFKNQPIEERTRVAKVLNNNFNSISAQFNGENQKVYDTQDFRNLFSKENSALLNKYKLTRDPEYLHTLKSRMTQSNQQKKYDDEINLLMKDSMDTIDNIDLGSSAVNRFIKETYMMGNTPQEYLTDTALNMVGFGLGSAFAKQFAKSGIKFTKKAKAITAIGLNAQEEAVAEGAMLMLENPFYTRAEMIKTLKMAAATGGSMQLGTQVIANFNDNKNTQDSDVLVQPPESTKQFQVFNDEGMSPSEVTPTEIETTPTEIEVTPNVAPENPTSFESTPEFNQVNESLQNATQEFENIDYTLYENVDSMPDGDLKNEIKNGQGTQLAEGVYITSDNKVLFFVDGIGLGAKNEKISIQDRTKKVVSHEVVGHLGLRKLKSNPTSFNEMLDNVYDSFYDDSEMDLTGNNDDTRLAAEEFLSKMAENTDLDNSRWDTVVEILTKSLRAFGVVADNMTKAEARQLLRQSYKNLKSANPVVEQTTNAQTASVPTSQPIPQTKLISSNNLSPNELEGMPDNLKEMIKKPDLINAKTGDSVNLELFHGKGKKTEYAEGVDSPALGNGKYLAIDENYAKEFGDVEKINVTLENPYVINNDKELSNLMGVESVPLDNQSRIPLLKTAREKVESLGHDGVIINVPKFADVDSDGNTVKRITEIFDSTQVLQFPSQSSKQSDTVSPKRTSGELNAIKNKNTMLDMSLSFEQRNKAEKEYLRYTSRFGKDPETGEVFFYNKLKDDELNDLAINGDKQAINEIDKRNIFEENDPDTELLKTITKLGGLISPSKSKDYKGELKEIHKQRARMFSDNGSSLDNIRGQLVEIGFNFDTVNDLLDSIDASLRGAAQYPDFSGKAAESTYGNMPFSKQKLQNFSVRFSKQKKDIANDWSKLNGIEGSKRQDTFDFFDNLDDIFKNEVNKTQEKTKKDSTKYKQKVSPKIKPRDNNDTRATDISRTAILDPITYYDELSKLNIGESISSVIFKELEGSRYPDLNPLIGKTINSAIDFALASQFLRNPYQEKLGAASLDDKGNIIDIELLTLGGIASSVADIKLTIPFLNRSKQNGATKFIIWHNHPSGNTTPSQADYKVTKFYKNAMLPLPFLDHIIINGDNYFSFNEGKGTSVIQTKKQDWEGLRVGRGKQINDSSVVKELAKAMSSESVNDRVYFIGVDTKNRMNHVYVASSKDVQQAVNGFISSNNGISRSAFVVMGEQDFSDAVSFYRNSKKMLNNLMINVLDGAYAGSFEAFSNMGIEEDGSTELRFSVTKASELANSPKSVKLMQKYKESEDSFWTEVWPKLLNRVGMKLKPSTRNFNRAAKIAVNDIVDWIKNNPKYLDYYNKDWAMTRDYLDEQFPGFTDDEFIAFRLMTGVTSPSTPLPGNIADSVQAINLWKKTGSLKSLTLRMGEKGRLKVGDGPFLLTSNTGATKVRALHVLENLYNQEGSWKSVNDLLNDPITSSELNSFKKSLGYKGGVASIGKVKKVVNEATGQDELIPRMFIFGEKVGAYTLNTAGDSRYTTTDIWESRFIRSHFPVMFKTATGLPVNLEEHKIFQSFASSFNKKFEERMGGKLEPSALQAARWFFMLKKSKEAGYRNANTNDTISGYTDRAIQTRLQGVSLDDYRASRGRSNTGDGSTDGSTELRFSKQSKNPVSAKDIESELTNLLRAAGTKAPVRVGRLRGRNVLGSWFTDTEVIRLKTANDIPTLAHEVAHGIDQAIYGRKNKAPWYGKLGKKRKQELFDLGYELYGNKNPNGGYVSEGFAEFVRYWMTGEKDVSKKAPEFLKWFESEFIKDNPDIAKPLIKSKELVQQWYAQGAKARAKASVVDKESITYKVKTKWDQIKNHVNAYRWIDTGDAVFDMVKEVESKLGRKLAIEEDPAQAYSNYRMTSSPRVQYMVDNGPTDIAGNRTGVGSLKDALSLVKNNREDFTIFLWAKRSIALWTDPKKPKGRNPGLSLDDALKIVEELSSPEFELAAQKVYAWNDGILNYAANASPTLEMQINNIRSVDPGYYIPLQREFSELERVYNASKLDETKGNISNRLKGSGRRIQDPFENMISNAERIISMTHKRIVIDKILELSKKEGLGFLIEKVKRGMQPVYTTNLADLADTVLDKFNQFADLDGVDLDSIEFPEEFYNEMVTFWMPEIQPKANELIVPIMENGKLQFYQVNPEMYKMLKGMDMTRLNPVLDFILAKPTRLFRVGTTGLRASFSLITNPIRDFRTLQLNSASNASSLELLYEWSKQMLTLGVNKASGGSLANTEWIDLWHRLGGQMSQPLTQDANFTRRTTRRLFQGRLLKTIDPRNMYDFIVDLFQFPESAARITEMKMIAKDIGWEPGMQMTPEQAQQLLLAGKQVTTDFTAAGAYAKIINQIVPFFNAGIQGPRAHLRAAKKNPMKFGRRMLEGSAIAVGLWALHQEEEWWEELEEWERYSYTYFPIDIGERKELIRIPRSFQADGLSMALPVAICESWKKESPEMVKEWVEQFNKTTVPDVLMGNPLVKLGVEQFANKNKFFDSPIVGQSLERKPSEEQYDDFTSSAAIVIGESLKLSPKRIDHAIQTMGGGAATDIVRAFGVGKTEENIAREMEKSEIPVIGTLFKRGGSLGVRQRSVNELREKHDVMLEIQASDKIEETELQRQVRLMTKDSITAINSLTYVRSRLDKIKDRDYYNRIILNIAKKMNSNLEKVNSGKFTNQTFKVERSNFRNFRKQSEDLKDQMKSRVK